MSASASLIPTSRFQTLRGKLVVDLRLSSPGKGRRTGMAQGPAGSLGVFTVLSVMPAHLGMRPALGNARFDGRAMDIHGQRRLKFPFVSSEENGRASGRERVGQYVSISVGD